LLIGSTAGNDMKISERKIEGYRNFVNKIWNIARFVLNQLKTEKLDFSKKIADLDLADLTLADQWILSKMHQLNIEVKTDIENHNFSIAGEKLRKFTREDFADWYLEISKIETNSSKKIILTEILKDLLKLWHPLIPFITETIWQKVASSMLMTESLPEENKYKKYTKEIADFDLIKQIIVIVRNARAQYKLNPQDKIKVFIQADDKLEVLKDQKNLLTNLQTNTEKIEITESSDEVPNAFYSQVETIKIYIPLEGIVDLDKEAKKLKTEIERLNKLLKSLDSKLNNQRFVKNAPKEIVKKEQIKQTQIKIKIKDLETQLQTIK